MLLAVCFYKKTNLCPFKVNKSKLWLFTWSCKTVYKYLPEDVLTNVYFNVCILGEIQPAAVCCTWSQRTIQLAWSRLSSSETEWKSDQGNQCGGKQAYDKNYTIHL